MGVSAALGLGIMGTAQAETKATVKLTVNGKSSTIVTDAPIVSDLLDERSVNFDNNDILTPGPNAKISDGLDVDLTRAVQVTVIDDGARFTQLVTSKRVADARRELNLPDATRKSSVFTAYQYVRARFYGPLGRKLARTERVKEGSEAIVHNIRVVFPRDEFKVNHRTIKDRSKLVRSGSKRVFKDGHNGRKRVVHRKTFVDGQLTDRSVAKKRWLKKPQQRVVRIGTGPNWIALARCESGGNPNAVNPSGYYGLYQFSLSTWHAVGGKGNPTDHGYWEQTKRAWKLFRGSGRSPWPYCGRFL